MGENMNKKWLLLLVPILIIVVIIVVFLMERSKVEFYETDEGKSVSIIGGADGPTSIFIAGKIGGDDDREEVMENEEMSFSVEVITASQAKEIMDNGNDYVILDVREADEFAEGHIDGAIQISYTELEAKAESILKDKGQLILVYCRSGRRSAIAGETLSKLGYTDVKDFGGIIDWPYEVVK